MRPSTRCVVRDVHDLRQGIVTPIYPSTAYGYLDADTNRYPRYFNTKNQEVVLETLCGLEGTEAGVLFGSGMAAISTVMRALAMPGDHVVLQRGLYGGSQAFMMEEFDELGIAYTVVDGDAAAVEAAVTEQTRVIYIESPTNPLVEIVDIEAVAAVGKTHGIATVIDNTFASPINQTPAHLGIDVVVHSGTKYLGGHSDLCCGVALSSYEITERIRRKARHYGGSLNAIDCYLLERSLKTLDVRVKRQTDNAMQIAQFLDAHSGVSRVHYPGLPSHPFHDVASRQMMGFGAMLAFEIEGVEAPAFMGYLRLVQPAMSLGGVETTICDPASTSHKAVSAQIRAEMGITDGMMRLSVGIEAAEDLIADFAQALDAVMAERQPAH